MRSFLVGGGLIVVDNKLLLAANRRRQGTLEWTPPGGVIDEGESITAGITREVFEETGLHVPEWAGGQHYTVTVVAADMGWQMAVESWFSTVASGEIALNDPDQIVEHAEFVDLVHVEALLADSPLWVRLPVLTWLDAGMVPVERFEFAVHGSDRATARVEQRFP